MARYYIQRKDRRNLETVDEFDSSREAYRMVDEYRLSAPAAVYYVSTRACKAYRG